MAKQKANKIKSWLNKKSHKIILSITLVILLLISSMYAVALSYISSQKNKPLTLGTTFIPDYASQLGLDPKSTFDALLSINVRHFRLTSYWEDSESVKGSYNFDNLDWQFNKAKERNAKIILVLGLRQPRWPECHMPTWAASENKSEWQPQLENYIKAVVNRYKDYPNLEAYQLENEYFLRGFGTCTDFSRDRLISEYNLVKQTDPHHEVIVSRSNNAIGMPIGKPTPDLFSISIYKRVWDAGFTHRYLEYPFPAWYYAFIAGMQEIFINRNMIIGELQAEAWPPDKKNITEIPISEQNKSLNSKRLEDRFKYGEATGMKQIYLWGSEYWYYRKTILHDPSLWNVAANNFKNCN